MSVSNVVSAHRTLFLGPRIPNHLKFLPKSLISIKKNTFRQLVKLIVLDFEGKNVTTEMYQSIKNTEENDINFDSIYGALYVLLKCALSFPETSLKQEIFREDLQELKIPGDYIDDLANIVYGTRKSSILSGLIQSAPSFPKLKRIQWRIDVAISSCTLNRVLEPTIVMEIELADGHKRTFEVHPSQFHLLRYSVASILKEMENLEIRNVLKL
ncbi:COMM domain-containing protein 5-like [Uloborus diversus]|uniref:COMM domain-containing protein 5-like n=1 Tax=Uloborus diversus TaxID=327109 RepID=UPI00240A5966|nr:COMM domain-containing protein 5-like [Uloborus diversus]